MKKTLSFLLSVLLLLAVLAPAALADVVWEPLENDFYKEHADEFSLCRERLILNGRDGTVTVYDKPDGKSLGTVSNGGKVNSEWIWKGSWYMIKNPFSDDWNDMAYVRGEDVVKAYDSDSFMAEYDAQIVSSNPPAKLTMPEGSDALCLYTYPGSGVVAQKFERDWLDGTTVTFNLLFKDEDGLTWGYIGYLYGMRDVWACLDDPTNEALPYKGRDTEVLDQLIPAAGESQAAASENTSESASENASESTSVGPKPSFQTEDKGGSLSPFALVAILVGAVVVVAAVLLVVLRRKNGRNAADRTDKT